jgi:hypothetical protein
MHRQPPSRPALLPVSSASLAGMVWINVLAVISSSYMASVTDVGKSRMSGGCLEMAHIPVFHPIQSVVSFGAYIGVVLNEFKYKVSFALPSCAVEKYSN